MKNSDFISLAVSILGDKDFLKSNGNLHFSNGVLFSYGKHYPLAFKVQGFTVINNIGYSVTFI